MIRYLIIICVTLLATNAFAQEETHSEITTYYFIRHAEKDRSDPTEKDAHLTEEGHQRAQNWSIIFQNVPFDAIYSTNFNRTKETAQPTADNNRLEINTYPVTNSYDDTFIKATKGKTILVVGHSNTIPDFVNNVIGHEKYNDIEDTNNGNLFIITIIDGVSSDMLLTIN
ncbi:SixA phosphatase family protein [Gelidibacter maritimus]|uniref:Histidine phosphatase family protein n=1 Tax=Gelidibacter maritimus TaxID=2761487 RepID=A0A7W2M1T8_9FLAO|nr:phosphoglycerate mutase family protein [Gelidibacter maritimus]MBA6151162.1 histidine phosphatase family protein [Gelidibacter maritimus]